MAPEDVEIRHLIRATRRSLVQPPFPPRRDLAFAAHETRTDGDRVLFRDVFWVRKWRICCYIVRLDGGGGRGMATAHALKALLRAGMRRYAADQAISVSLGALRALGFAELDADVAAVTLRTDTGDATFAATGAGTAVRLPVDGDDSLDGALPTCRARLECGQLIWLSIGDVERPTLTENGHPYDATDLVHSALSGIRNAVAVAIGPNTLRQGRERTFMLSNDVGGISPVLADITDYLLSEGISESALVGLDVALDEMLTNIVLYAYDDGEAHEIIIHLSLEEDTLRIELRDDGMPFDPTAAATADTTLDIEDRPIGGLGLHFVKIVFDSMTYRRVLGWNMLVLDKRLTKSSLDRPAMASVERLS